MKKHISVFLMLSLIASLSLAGCGKLETIELPPLPSETAEAAPTAEPTQEPVIHLNENPTVISVRKSTKQAYDPQNGTKLILEFSYETPKVEMPQRSQVADAINEQIAVLDELFYTGDEYHLGYNDMLTLAEDAYNYMVEDGREDELLNSSVERTVKIKRLDDSILSVYYFDYSYASGSAHGSYNVRGYCFDTETGEKLTLEAISLDYDTFAQFLVNHMLNQMATDDSYLERMEGFVPNDDYAAAFATLLRDGSWFFDEDGMVIFSDLYEMSSYAAGIIEFTVPYSDLAPYIDDKYLPKELDADGALSVIAAESANESELKVIDSLTLNDEGQQVYLMVDGCISNLSITSVEYIDGIGHFYEKNLYRHYSGLENNAILLTTLMPEGMPNLCIRYTSLGGEKTFYLSESGKDGSIILVDDSIAALG